MKSLAVREQRVAAELGHGDLEGDARAQAGLLEEHAERLAAQQRQLVGGARRLEMRGQRQHLCEFARREIDDPQQMAATQAALLDKLVHDMYSYA